MTKKIKLSELPKFDAAEYLNSEEDVAAYLTTILEENDPALLARTGFRLLLQACADIEVVAEADSGEAACQMYESVAPDVVVMAHSVLPMR